MRETIKWGITKVQRHLRVIKLGKLMKRGIGTALVEKMTDMLTADERVGPNSMSTMAMVKRRRVKVVTLMEMKIKDGEEDLKLGNVQYHKIKQKLTNILSWETYIEVMAVVREEM